MWRGPRTLIWLLPPPFDAPPLRAYLMEKPLRIRRNPMALLPILTLPDPRLREISKAVEKVDGEIHRLLDDMLETMYDAPGVGLAAIQVGHAKRIVVIDIAKDDQPKAPLFLINPEITWVSEELGVYREGCLSVPECFEEVQRPARVRFRHLDRDGVLREAEADGLLATVVQHELDHLEGGLFIDHLSRLKRERVVKKFTKAARLEARSSERETEDVDA